MAATEPIVNDAMRELEKRFLSVASDSQGVFHGRFSTVYVGEPFEPNYRDGNRVVWVNDGDWRAEPQAGKDHHIFHEIDVWGYLKSDELIFDRPRMVQDIIRAAHFTPGTQTVDRSFSGLIHDILVQEVVVDRGVFKTGESWLLVTFQLEYRATGSVI